MPAALCCAVVCLQEAMAAGHRFQLSTNGVLLCEGPLPVCFVQQVTQQELTQLWAAQQVQE